MDLSLTEAQQHAWRILIKSRIEALGFSQSELAARLGTKAEEDSWKTRLSLFVNGESKVLQQVFGKERHLSALAKGLDWSTEQLKSRFDEVRGLETQDPEGTARIAGCEVLGTFSANRVHVPLRMARFNSQLPNTVDERLRKWGFEPVSAEALLRYLDVTSGLAVLVVVPQEMGKTLLLQALAELLTKSHHDFAWWRADAPPDARVLLVDSFQARPGHMPTLSRLISEGRLAFVVASEQPQRWPIHPSVIIQLQPPDAAWASRCLHAHAELLNERSKLVVDADLLVTKLTEFAPSNSWMTPRTLGLLLHDGYLGDKPDPTRPVNLVRVALASARRRLEQLRLKEEATWLSKYGELALIRWSRSMAIPEQRVAVTALEKQVRVALARVGLVNTEAEPLVRHRALALAAVAQEVIDSDFEEVVLIDRLAIDPVWQDALLAAIRGGSAAGKRAGQLLKLLLKRPPPVLCLAMGLLTRLLGEPIDAAYVTAAKTAQQRVLAWWWRLSEAKRSDVPWAQLARASLQLAKHIPEVSVKFTKLPLPHVLKRYLDGVAQAPSSKRARADFLALAAPFQTERTLEGDFWEKAVEWAHRSDVGWAEEVSPAEGKAWLDIVMARLEKGGELGRRVLLEQVVFHAGVPGQRTHWKTAMESAGPAFVPALARAARLALSGPKEDLQVLEEVRRRFVRGPVVDALGKELGALVCTYPGNWVQRPVLQWALAHCDDESRERAWDIWLKRGPDVPWREFMEAGLNPKRLAGWALELRLEGANSPKPRYGAVRDALVELGHPEALRVLAEAFDPWAIQKLRTDPKCRAERLWPPLAGVLLVGLETTPADSAALETLARSESTVVALLARLHLARLHPSNATWARARQAVDALERECEKHPRAGQEWSGNAGEVARLTALAARQSPTECRALCGEFLQRPLLRVEILEHLEFWFHALSLLTWAEVVASLRAGHRDGAEAPGTATEIRVRGLILCKKGKELRSLVDDPQLGSVIGMELAKHKLADADLCEQLLAGFAATTDAKTILVVLQSLTAQNAERGIKWLAQPNSNIPKAVRGEVLRTLPVEKQLEVLNHWERAPAIKRARRQPSDDS
jgi:transcriptional regulator with XRE-family HTH domain